MHNTTMHRPGRLPLLAGLATLAVLTAGLTPAATAEPAPSVTDITLKSGTTGGLVSDWYIENDEGGTRPDDTTCSYDLGLGVNDAYYDLGGTNGLSDAFDGGLTFFVGEHRLAAGETWDVTTDDDGVTRAVTAAGITTGDLTATVEYRAMASRQVLRSITWLTNPGSEPVSTPFSVYTNLGSDSDTSTAGTSSGNSQFNDDDRWVVTTDDLELAPSDPVLTHVLAGPGEVAVGPTATALGATQDECFWTDDLRYAYQLTVQPGETVGVLMFTEMSRTNADALTAAARFNTNPATNDELVAGLSDQQRAAIVNWNFTPPAPPAPHDGTPPTSEADGPTRTADETWTVTYDASDVGFGLRTVDLHVKAPGETTFTKVATDTGTFDGEFTYTAEGDGSYAFYTTATDHGGNVEAAPATADVTTLVDQTAPISSSSSTPLRNRATIPVSYDIDDAAGVGVAKVDLFAKGPGASSYIKVATDTDTDGVFRYIAAGDGVYAFYTTAIDRLGNTESAPAAADTTTRVDRTAPILKAKMGEAPVRFDISEQSPLMLRMRVSERAGVVFLVRQHGDLVRKLGWHPVARGLVEKKWNGRDTDRRRVADGRYILVMKAKDRAGNVTVLRMPVRVTR